MLKNILMLIIVILLFNIYIANDHIRYLNNIINDEKKINEHINKLYDINNEKTNKVYNLKNNDKNNFSINNDNDTNSLDKNNFMNKIKELLKKKKNNVIINDNEMKAILKNIKENNNENILKTANNDNDFDENKSWIKKLKHFFLEIMKKEKDLYDLKPKEKKFYSLKLKEENFRWYIPFSVGTNKKIYNLAIVTSNFASTLYCTINSKNEEDHKLKYELNESDNSKLIGCNSIKCENLNTDKCYPLDNFLKNINKFVFKKRNCTNRFCDYVKNINFLNMNKITNDINSDICAFDLIVGIDEIKGFYFRDIFYINKTVFTFYDYFGCITEGNDLKFNDNISGYIGLSVYDKKKDLKYPSILNTFIKKTISNKNIFALCFVENGGIISFGGYEKDLLNLKNKDSESTDLKLEEEKLYDIIWISYSNPNKTLYTLYLHKINIDKNISEKITKQIKKDVQVDSYNYFISLPDVIFAQIKLVIYTVCSLDKQNDCTKIDKENIMKLNNNNISNYPKIELEFSAGTVDIEPKDYIISTGNNSYRILLNAANVVKLGIPFFLNKYLIFNNEKKKLGISKSDCKMEIDENDIKGMILKDDSNNENIANEIETQSFFKRYKLFIITFAVLSFILIIFVSVIICA